MPSIVATPIGSPAIPDWVTLNSLFDQPAPILGFLGVPVWFVIGCGIILLIILVTLSWVFKLRRMSAVKGFKEIQKKAGPDDVMTWLFGKTQRMIIECLKYAGGVASYYNPLRISKWHLTSPMAMAHIGGYPAMLVSDDYDQSRDPVSEIALCHACDQYNANLNEVREQLVKNGAPVDRVKNLHTIENYLDYKTMGHEVLKSLYPEGIPIPAYSIFNPVKFRKIFPKGRDSTFFGGVQLRKARKLKARVQEKGWLEKHLPIMIIAAIIIIVNIAAWNVKLGAP